MAIALFFLLAWFSYCIFLLIRPGSPSLRRSAHLLTNPSNQGDLTNPGNQGDWDGVREPRRPRPPYWPPRAAAVVPEDAESQESGSAAGYTNAPRQPLRLEDEIA